ncbi:SHOCT domain-containing protein [Halobellus rarus]|uniref:SHOCT domain-containing protein n=1 Tax=Halobellus rarus TaxID=1126237 RepID=A0ABD6CM01_9EURY|nr:SHOCT domain-containing protein [Halobellus rarus]
MLLWYGVLFAVGRYRRQSAESSGGSAAEGIDATGTTETGSTGFLGRRESDDAVDERPIQRLRTRYAEGEIDHAEFERRLEALVETEDRSGKGSTSVTLGDDVTRSVERER